MNRNELIKVFAEENKLELSVAEKIVTIFFDSMKTSLAEGGRVEIRGFGSFKMKDYEGYIGRNPKTGERVEVKPKRMPFFKTGRDFLKFLNEGVTDEINQ